MANRLTTTRYTLPGVYIGQLISPAPGNLTADARVTSFVGQGSRLAKVINSGIRRSFIFEEDLDVATSAPFEATLDYAATGDQTLPNRVFDSITGVELRQDQWQFVQVAGENKKIQIAPEAYDPTADYKIDYQSSSREVKDPIPFADLRTISAVGTSPDRAQFRDYLDFYVPYDYAGPTADSGNSITSSFLTSVLADSLNTGGGTVTIASAASFNHDYNRFYELEVTNIAGAPGTYTATLTWLARPYSGGQDAEPPVPLHSSASKPSFTIDETNPSSLIVDLELGVKVDFAFGATNFAIGDKFYFNGVGPGLFEFDSRHTNTNQYTEFSNIVPTLVVGSTGGLSYSVNNTYTGTYNSKYRLEVTAAGGAIGSRTVTFVWAGFGDIIGPTSVVTVSETSPTFTLTNGIELVVNFGGSNYVVGDQFDLEVKAPRIFYQAKDNRVYDLTVSTATNPGADVGYIEGSYSTGTPEGGFGSWSADANLLTGVNAETGIFSLPDGLYIFARNMMRGNVNGTSYAPSDKFVGSITSDDVIDWSLTQRVEELRETTSVAVDVTGAVTGNPGDHYVIVSNIYETGTVDVVTEAGGTPVSFYEIPGTRFIGFMSQPTETLRITYEYRGEEPSPGQLYYITALYVRPDNLYNNPQLVLTRADGRILLAPSEVTNHLYIENEIAFDNAIPGAYYIQPKDADGDGILTREDFREALEAHKSSSRATDLVVLSNFESLSDSLQINEEQNDPFEQKEQMLWVGAPIGTPIGDADTPDSLVFLATKTLQTTPQSPAIGTRVLAAPTEARRSITLENQVSATITMDGSFVAGGLSALTNSYSDPGDTILRQNLNGFSYIQTYSEPENLILGQASTVFFTDQGSSVYRIEEDITVHTLAEEFQLISATTQKQFVTRVVRREMDNSLISVVVPSAQAAVGLIRSVLSGILVGLSSRGITGDYQGDAGNVRAFDPDRDIVVIPDPQSLTRYDFFYAYWLRAPIKRLFGLYSVNTADLASIIS